GVDHVGTEPFAEQDPGDEQERRRAEKVVQTETDAAEDADAGQDGGHRVPRLTLHPAEPVGEPDAAQNAWESTKALFGASNLAHRLSPFIGRQIEDFVNPLTKYSVPLRTVRARAESADAARA